MQLKSTGGNRGKIPVWEQLATDQADPWQVVPRQVFTLYDCLLISVAFVVLCHVDCLWVTGEPSLLDEKCPKLGCIQTGLSELEKLKVFFKIFFSLLPGRPVHSDMGG